MIDEHRKTLAKSRKVIVKIGSKAIAADGAIFKRIARDVREIVDNEGGKRRHVVVVSSGAIALGADYLGMKARPRVTQSQQAAAAAGQSLLMQRYGKAFHAVDLKVAQVLLTHADLARRLRANNARAALTKLLALDVVPIINENDAVAVDEIRFGDNDELAAMVAPLVDASLLILLSDVAGLLDDQGRRIPLVERIDAQIEGYVTGRTSTEGTGGMASKLESVRRATLGGTHAVIAPANAQRVLSRVLAGEDVGTFFPARQRRLKGRKHWIAYTLRPRGVAILDRGAERAIREGGRSVLCVGVVGVRGDFVIGDPISLVSPDGNEMARGLSKLSAADAARLAGKRLDDDTTLLVHRDDLVLMPSD
jgi:glutamate 5-kinase